MSSPASSSPFSIFLKNPLIAHYLSHFDPSKWESVIRDTLVIGIESLHRGAPNEKKKISEVTSEGKKSRKFNEN